MVNAQHNVNFTIKFKKMNIVVTGANKGIGLEIVKLFSESQDNKVFAISKNTGNLHKLNISNVKIIQFDLEEVENFSQLANEINSEINKIDILINNAGFLVNKSFANTTIDDFEKSISVNVKAPYFLIQQLLPYFASPSHIVNITSMGGFMGSLKFAGLSAYSTSKGALSILTECLAEELRDKQISVNALALGAIQTEMLSNAFPTYKAPLQPEQIAEFICHFAVNNHKYMNGKIIPVSLSTP